MTRAVLAGLVTSAVLVAAGCGGGGDDKPPPGNQVDRITAATAVIVFQCRAVERGFLSTVDEDALTGSVDALVESVEEFDLDATFLRPPPAVDPETTLREQIELAIARLEDDECSPADAERLRDAIDD